MGGSFGHMLVYRSHAEPHAGHRNTPHQVAGSPTRQWLGGCRATHCHCGTATKVGKPLQATDKTEIHAEICLAKSQMQYDKDKIRKFN